MEADWSVACGAEDPVVAIPWQEPGDATGSLRYVDLRKTPGSIEKIPEAGHYACLAAVLRRWNLQSGHLFTAKCDVWTYAAKDFEVEDLPGFAFAHASYIDLILDAPAVFSNFAACELLLQTWTASAASIEIPQCRCEWTLRSAQIFAENTLAEANAWTSGFAITLYVWGYGNSPAAAAAFWCTALEALADLVLDSVAARSLG